ncbi:MAG: Xaa-Pro aminopeptidase [Myxococcota bacterium]
MSTFSSSASRALEQSPDSAATGARDAIYAARRERYMETIGRDAVALIHSPPESVRNGDVHYPFRQSSDLLYLTGFAEPEATLILRPGADEERVVMFVRPRDKEREIWDGRRAGVDGAKQHYGADEAYPIAELDERLIQLIANVDELYYSVGIDPAFDRTVCDAVAHLRRMEKRGRRAPRAIVDPRVVLHEMRLHKSADELAVMRRACEISAEAHIEAMKAARDGGFEYELEALIDYTFRRRGGTGRGYNTIVGAGENATILHYTENDCPLRDGQLVLIDAGCEYRSYTADITRTFPVSGRFSPAQRRVYEVVLRAQKSAIAMARPGVTLDEIHDHCVAELTAGMIELGLLDGAVEERIEDKAYRQFYMHRTSHWLGMDVHDVGAYTERGTPRPLAPGMIITIEPGLYIAADSEDVADEYKGIGVRIEDDILITEGGCDNLTAAAPKECDEIEALCSAS